MIKVGRSVYTNLYCSTFFVIVMKQRLLTIYFRLLGVLARWYILKRKPYIVGINGSVGKTSCRMIVHQTLSQLLPKLTIETSPKNFNGELGMSLSIFGVTHYTPTIFGMIKALRECTTKRFFSAKKPYDVILLEYGIDHPGEMAFLVSIAKPHCSIHTQIDAVHSLQFGNPDNIAREEFLLQQNTRTITFLNTDDPYLHHITETLESMNTVDMITYSATGASTGSTTISINPIGWKVENSGQWQWEVSSPTIVQQNMITFNKSKTIKLGINLLWDYHMAYAAVWVCLSDIIARQFFQKEAVIQWQDISLHLSLQPWRWSIFAWIHNSIIIDSTYNSSPRSVSHIIESTTQRRDSTHPNHKLLFVLWDMRELWTEEYSAHEHLAQLLQQQNATIFLIWQSMKDIVMTYLHKHGLLNIATLQWFPHYQAVWQHLQWYLLQQNNTPHILIFKWSQNTIFLEEAIKYVLANKSDESQLTRQWDRRAHKKNTFLKTYGL